MNALTLDQLIDFTIYMLKVFSISFVFTLFILAAIFFIPFLNAMEQKSKQQKFNKALSNGIRKKEITNSELGHIAERWNQDRKSVLFNLRVMLSDYFMQENEDQESIKAYIVKLLEAHEKDEPFAELPRNISLQMNSIQKSLNEADSDKIEQLASSLSLLYASNQKEISRQNNRNKAGLFLAILGVLLTVVSFLPKLQLVFS